MGPLKGYKVIEIAGIGPCPIAGMMLADLGAEVTLVERLYSNSNAAVVGQQAKSAFFRRGKRSIALDLKSRDSVDIVLELLQEADILIEGFRPGVMERLGLGPETCMQRNASLVYGRMTGWGQYGPLAQAAGHDLNYLAISGILHYGGLPGDAPYPTPTVLGDIGSGSNMLVIGVLSALMHAQKTGEGQVIDAAICDGALYNQTLLASVRAEGAIGEEPGVTFFRAASHWCNTYTCSDGKYITVQALEPNFYRELITLCGFLDDPDFSQQHDAASWPAAREKMAMLFAQKPQEHWCALLEGTDACFAPVLTLPEAAQYPHIKARDCFLGGDNLLQPSPAPRFSVTPQQVGEIPVPGQHTQDILESLNANRVQR